MNLESLKALATSKVARQVLQTKKHSPKILFVAGTIGVVGATVLACRATLKLDDVLQEHEKNLADLSEIALSTDSLQSDEHKKANLKLKVKTGLEITKLYAPSVGLTVVSIAALTGSHVILTKRNGAVMAAYAGLDRAYKQYRQNVVEKYGEDEDNKFSLGAQNVHVEEKTTTGKKITVKSQVTGKKGASPYAAVFDEHSHKFTTEPGMNSIIVGMQQSHANDKLRANGHLFLNEVYDMLGLPRTKAGAVVGWIWRNDNEPKNGDNYVSFGIFEGDVEGGEDFVNGLERSIWLDFNVDGVIYDLI